MSKNKIINDPVYGFIPITSEKIFRLIEHPFMQRMRHIRQLGLAELIYPGAIHTRFHHALGAMHLMRQALEVLISKGTPISEEEIEAAQIATLLHDTGHGPFSHALEETLLTGVKHESISYLLMKELNRQFRGELDLALKIFQNTYSRKFLHQLVSSQLDIDRLDYLNRDSFFTGVKEGAVGTDRIIAMLDVVKGQIVVEEKGIYNIESFLSARRLMYWQVYLHKTSVSAERLLVNIIRRAQYLAGSGESLPASETLSLFLKNSFTLEDFSENRNLLEAFGTLDDNDVWGAIKHWQSNRDPVLSQLCNMLLQRKLFQIKLSIQSIQKSEVEKVKEKIVKEFKLRKNDAAYLFSHGMVSNEAYLADHHPIQILMKSGELVDVAQASDLPNIKAMSKIVKKTTYAGPKTYLCESNRWVNFTFHRIDNQTRSFMEFTVNQIAGMLGGIVRGDGDQKVSMLAKIQDAQQGQVTFLANPKYEQYIYTTRATAVIVQKDFQPKKDIQSSLVLVEDPYSSFTVLLEEYHKLVSFQKSGVEQPSFIGEKTSTGKNIYRGAFSYIGSDVVIGDNVKIYPHVFIGDNVSIGSNVILHPNVKLYAGTKIGSNCVVHSGTVIGSDGFGFAPQEDGTYKAIPQMGNVIIEDNVVIGANTVIDCATLAGDSTIIREGVKLDNLIQIAHNVEVGKNTVIAAQAGISGSSRLGENCVIGGQVGIAGHLVIANNTSFGAQAGISKSITKEGEKVIGYPAYDVKEYFKSYAVFKKLPDLNYRLRELEKKLGITNQQTVETHNNGQKE